MESLALRSFILVLFISFSFHFYFPTKAQSDMFSECAAMNYTSGNVYQRNLNLTLTSLAAIASLTGYYNTAIGQVPNVVFGLVQCRGYASKADCQTCASNAVTEIRQRCPIQNAAFILNDICLLRYSNSSFFSSADKIPKVSFWSFQNATEPVLFSTQLRNLLHNLSLNAAVDASRLAFGSSTHNISAMVQCTRDIAGNKCLRCLQNIISYIPQVDVKVGGQIFSLSCNFRYEIYSFFVLPSPRTASPLPPSPSLLQPTFTNTTNDSSKNYGKISKTLVIVVAPAAVILVVVLILSTCLFWNKARRSSGHMDVVNEDGNNSIESLSISLNTLRVATGNFSESYKLGQGGFGPVYKGKLNDGREIAVKRLSRSSGQGLAELKTEVMLVAKLLHRNLVRVLGFCLEEEKLLVYEYLPNGSLDKILFDQNRQSSLEWERRYKIIVGIARGLLYLQEDSQLKIVHRDLKASNILLDEHMNPKISDFGLARLFSGSQTQANTKRIAGTYGYMAPEYAKKGQFSTKSDVYSFGILVLEIVTGKKNSSFHNFTNLQSHAWEHWANGTVLDLLDPTMGDQWSKPEILRCINIGLLCVQEAVVDRPSMSEIVVMLGSCTTTSPSPLQPAFFVSEGSHGSNSIIEDSGAAHELHKSKLKSSRQSINDVSITELYPR